MDKTATVSLDVFLSYFMFKEVQFDENGTAEQSSSIVRIYYNADDLNHWFDFGISDFADDLDPLDTVLSPELLSRKISGFCVDDGRMCVTLAKDSVDVEDDDDEDRKADSGAHSA